MEQAKMNANVAEPENTFEEGNVKTKLMK